MRILPIDNPYLNQAMIIEKEIETKIQDLITGRFKQALTVTDVYNWLSNFKEPDIPTALRILEKLEYLSVNMCIKLYNDHLRRILRDTSKKQILLLPIGDFGKSGSAMIYLLKQTPTMKDRRLKRTFYLFASLQELEMQWPMAGIDPAEALLLFVDDYLGSGRSLIDFYNGKGKERGVKDWLDGLDSVPEMKVISLLFQTDTKEYLARQLPFLQIYGEERGRIFAPEGSPFGHHSRMIPVREMAYTYGKKLRTKEISPLGYRNSQGLVAFAHSTPNNTLPIIWANMNSWRPLFPRFGQDKIEKANQLIEESRYWLSIARQLNIRLFQAVGVDLYSRINVQLLALATLLRQRRSVPYICQTLGLTLGDVDNLVEEGQRRGIFKKDGRFTKKGEKALQEIAKKSRVFQKKTNSLLETKSETMYIPTVFRGLT